MEAPRSTRIGVAIVLFTATGIAVAACSSAGTNDVGLGDASSGGTTGAGAGPGGGHAGTHLGTGGSAATGGGIALGGAGGSGGAVFTGDPKTCDEAAASKSYIGCDYWPTVVANNVWSIFDFAIVVANAGTEDANITVTRGSQTIGTAPVQAGHLLKAYLPWVPELKGPDADQCGAAAPLPGTIGVVAGAYHLVSDRPVTVYQFNALEYKGQGGPSGKNWSSCPGNDVCVDPNTGQSIVVGCFSFSNDASLLLPSTAMTGNYRIAGQASWHFPGPSGGGIGTYAAITGVADGTQVAVKLGPHATILAGAGIAAAGPGQIISFGLNAGDVVELVADDGMGTDLSGSQIQASNPVQVITGMPCDQAPIGVQACDHIEESVFPAETLGKHYFVTVPTSPGGAVVGHLVRFYGNADGTTLTYAGAAPSGAPTKLNAGDVVEIGPVNQDFEVTGDHEFIVGSFMLGAELQDPGQQPPNQKGDPSQSFSTAVEQYRTKYIFLAPDDYDESWIDIVMPGTAHVTLDGSPVSTASGKAISSGYGVVRTKLGPGQGGAHVLQSDQPVGIQVMGYGAYTSYQYPGGLNLTSIAPPPMPIVH